MRQSCPRIGFIVTILASTALVGGGLYLATALRLAACPLCIIQRMLYMVLAVLSLIGIAVAQRRAGQAVFALLNAVVAGTGVFVAAYQVWLQRFAHNVSCTADEPWWESFVDWAGMKVPFLFEANGMCSDPAWKFLGLSIADWSTLAFAGLLIVALVSLTAAVRKER